MMTKLLHHLTLSAFCDVLVQSRAQKILIHEDVSPRRAGNLWDLLTATSLVVRTALGTQAVLNRYLLHEGTKSFLCVRNLLYCYITGTVTSPFYGLGNRGLES